MFTFIPIAWAIGMFSGFAIVMGFKEFKEKCDYDNNIDKIDHRNELRDIFKERNKQLATYGYNTFDVEYAVNNGWQPERERTMREILEERNRELIKYGYSGFDVEKALNNE